MTAAQTRVPYAISGKNTCHSQSSPTGAYAFTLRMRRMTRTEYPRPPMPTVPTEMETVAGVWCGELRMAAISSTRQKCTTVGLANASTPVSGAVLALDSLVSVMTTNINPVTAPADDPTITEKLSQPATTMVTANR